MKSLLLVASVLATTLPPFASATPPAIHGAHFGGATQRASADQHGVLPQSQGDSKRLDRGSVAKAGHDTSGYGGMMDGARQTGRMSLTKSERALYAHH